MSKTTYLIEITIGDHTPIIHRLPFSSYERAEAQIKLLEPKIGLGKFQNDDDSKRHTIKADDGEMVVVLEKITSVRLVDRKKFDNLTKYALDHDIKVQKALVPTKSVTADPS